MENLMSDNLGQVEKLDDFVRDFLKDKCKQKDWEWMSHLKNINRRIPV